MLRVATVLLAVAPAFSALSGDGAPLLTRLSGGLERPIYSAAPLALNTTNFQFDLDASIQLVGDWDVSARRFAAAVFMYVY